MNLYIFYGYIYGDYVAGIVKANNKSEAKKFLKNTYDDYDQWKDKTLEKIEFDNDNVIEIYYG
jgi:hypothetical protein